MLYELLAGAHALRRAGHDFAVAYRHVTSDPPQLDVPASLWSAVSSMLAKDPAARPAAADAAATLRRLARQLADAPALTPTTDPESFAEVERPATVVRGVRPGSGAAGGAARTPPSRQRARTTPAPHPNSARPGRRRSSGRSHALPSPPPRTRPPLAAGGSAPTG